MGDRVVFVPILLSSRKVFSLRLSSAGTEDMRLIQLLLAVVVIHRSIVGGEHAEHIEDDADLADMLDEQELEHSMREGKSW